VPPPDLTRRQKEGEKTKLSTLKVGKKKFEFLKTGDGGGGRGTYDLLPVRYG